MPDIRDSYKSGEQTLLWGLIALAAIVLALPVWLIVNQPTTDGPSHLAELFLLLHAHGHPILSKFYAVEWALVPNIGSELFVAAFGKLFPLELLIRVFVSAGVISWVVGPAAVQWALYRRIQPTALLGSVFAYNGSFVAGFWSCYLGLGLSMLFFAAWIRWREGSNLIRIPLFAAALVATYLCHLIAAVSLIFLIATFEMGSWKRGENFWRLLLATVGTVAIITVPTAFLFLLRPHSAPAKIIHGGIRRLPERLFSILETNMGQPYWLVVVAILALFLIGIRTRVLNVHPALRFTLICLAGLCLALPDSLGGGGGVDLRLPALEMSVLCAATSMSFGFSYRSIFVGATSIMVIILSSALYTNWHRLDERTSEYRTALRSIPEGSRIFPVIADTGVADTDVRLLFHLDSYAVVDRSAFASLLLTTRGQHIVHTTDAMNSSSAQVSDEGKPPLLSMLPLLRGPSANARMTHWHRSIINWPCNFDVAVLLRDAGPAPASVPPEFELIREGAMFAIYQIRKPKTCRPNPAI